MTVGAGEPALWLVPSSGPAGGEGAELLDAQEGARLRSLRREADRRTYLAAHVTLRRVLGERLGVPPEDVVFEREPCVSCGAPHGRPRVAGGAGGVHFSLSHSGELALVGLAGAPLGVDVEAFPAPPVVADLVTALHPAEQAELTALPERERVAAFTRVWVRKEAYLKGLGAGVVRSVALDHVGAGPSPAPLPAPWTLRDVPCPPGYGAAVAFTRAP
ncbi:4'-phosphopantetheinyl transferase superfamily protein [Streptomyces sp. NPDC051940]|uniref:4'-phosphopantetheinyl transferase family protein n=1 Tax=Streptomyces sp. NPDC051940 TaxID=3155675 RepID=UPI003437F29B